MNSVTVIGLSRLWGLIPWSPKGAGTAWVATQRIFPPGE
jgi:hypothetical protein